MKRSAKEFAEYVSKLNDYHEGRPLREIAAWVLSEEEHPDWQLFMSTTDRTWWRWILTAIEAEVEE